MAETIWVRFSAGGANAAEVAALPVVVCDWVLVAGDLVVSVACDLVLSAGFLVWAFILSPLLSVAPFCSALVLPVLLSRPSAFMSLPPLVSVSELMLFDFSPAGDLVSCLVSCALLLAGIFSFDSDAFMPLESEPLVPCDYTH